MEKIQLRAIIEILGRPPEHIIQGLKMLADQMKNDPSLKIIEETHHAPVKVKDSQDLYTTFMEITIEVQDMNALYGFLFQYMPANIEIISPENIKLSNQEMNQAANHLVQRLHQYDAVTKKMIGERDMAVRKLFEVAPHLFKKQDQQDQHAHQPQTQQAKKDNSKSKSSKKRKSKK